MRLNHPDYIKLVTEVYKKKRADNELSPLLAQPTPGNVRRECANVYQERYEKKDEPVLRAFFGPAEHGKKFLAAIQDFPINRFKSLDKFLKGDGKKGINDRNLNLLAWLIDFKYRPFVIGMDVILSEDERSIIIEPVNIVGESDRRLNPEQTDSEADEKTIKVTIDDGGKNLPPQIEYDSAIITKEIISPSNTINKPPKKIPKREIFILLCLIVCFAGIYIIRNYDSPGKKPYGNTNTTTVAPEDTISMQKADTLISDKKDNSAVKANVNKKELRPDPMVLDSSHCLKITKKGMQCKRKGKNNGYYCWQHGG